MGNGEIGGHIGCIQGLYLSPCSGTIPSDVQGTICDARVGPVQGKHPTHCTVSLVHTTINLRLGHRIKK